MKDGKFKCDTKSLVQGVLTIKEGTARVILTITEGAAPVTG